MRKGVRMKTVTYGAYTIKSVPLPLFKTHEWKVNVSIFWIQDGVTIIRRVTCDSTYPTESGADLFGITYGQHIIDGEFSTPSSGEVSVPHCRG